jgi:hypothetical protein
LSELIRQIGNPDEVWCEHFGFIPLINQVRLKTTRLRIYPQNIETLHEYTCNELTPTRMRAAVMALADEIAQYGMCESIHPISRLETNFLLSIGQRATHFPYTNEGPRRVLCEAVKLRRKLMRGERDYWVLMGGFSHGVTSHGTKWWIDNVLPLTNEKVKIVLPGSHKDSDLSSVRHSRKVTAPGFLDQDSYIELLAGARGVIIPNLMGFGSLVRMRESLDMELPTVCSMKFQGEYSDSSTLHMASADPEQWAKVINSQ